LAILHETAPVWLPDYAVAEAQPLRVFTLLALAFALVRELAGEGQLDRARLAASQCGCALAEHSPSNARCQFPSARSEARSRKIAQELYIQLVEKRFSKVNRCC
jgi:hypothetical protein